MSGKGDKQRKCQVSDEQLAANLQLAFAKDNQAERINKNKKKKHES